MRIRLGMVGGGPGSMIGGIHRAAAWLDNHYELVCGVFSNDFAKSKQLGNELGLSKEQIYSTYQQMFSEEAAKPVEQRMEVVSIVTPNHLHYKVAKLALQCGFHVILDKPITHTLREACDLQQIVEQSARLFCVTYTYSGYPMIKEARDIVHRDVLGKIRKVTAEFSQGWLASAIEEKGNKQATWRTQPILSGLSGTIADIGVHAFHLLEYTTGCRTKKISANVNTLVGNRQLDDNATLFLKLDNDVDGFLCASQVASGEEANLILKIYGEKGGLIWSHKDPNTIRLQWLDKPAEVLRAGYDNLYLSAPARHNCRTPAGHPEGFIEAFANHYRNFALHFKAIKQRQPSQAVWQDYPQIGDGVRGMAFIEAVMASGREDAAWITLH